MSRPLALIPAGLLALTACGGGGQQAGADSITVFAAASLNEVFEEVGELYTEETGTEVEFNIAGSSTLVEQLENGAPADVLATADDETMRRAEQAGLTAEIPQIFATNAPVLVTPVGNPAGISGLEDLERDDVVSVVCAPQVPCGAAAEQLAESAGTELSPASEEPAVTDVLGKVRSGEADAGVVYATDAQAAGDEVETIEPEGAEDVVNHYPAAALDAAENSDAAEQFLAHLARPEAEEILRESGFRPATGDAW